MSVSPAFFWLLMPMSACVARLRPSKPNGRVTPPMVTAPRFRAISARMGAPPVPAPPPPPAAAPALPPPPADPDDLDDGEVAGRRIDHRDLRLPGCIPRSTWGNAARCLPTLNLNSNAMLISTCTEPSPPYYRWPGPSMV